MIRDVLEELLKELDNISEKMSNTGTEIGFCIKKDINGKYTLDITLLRFVFKTSSCEKFFKLVTLADDLLDSKKRKKEIKKVEQHIDKFHKEILKSLKKELDLESNLENNIKVIENLLTGDKNGKSINRQVRANCC